VPLGLGAIREAFDFALDDSFDSLAIDAAEIALAIELSFAVLSVIEDRAVTGSLSAFAAADVTGAACTPG